jgi:hypothetical protein
MMRRMMREVMETMERQGLHRDNHRLACSGTLPGEILLQPKQEEAPDTTHATLIATGM